jgi:hypothetical protein
MQGWRSAQQVEFGSATSGGKGRGTAGAEGGNGGTGNSTEGIFMRVDESRGEQARRSRPELLLKPKRTGGSGGYVGGGGREVREASCLRQYRRYRWMKRARLRRMERVSPMRVALAELFKPK